MPSISVKKVGLLCIWAAWVFTCLQQSTSEVQFIGPYSRSLFFTILAYLGISLVITFLALRPIKLVSLLAQNFSWPDVILILLALAGGLLWALVAARAELKIFPTIALLFISSIVLEQTAPDGKAKRFTSIALALLLLGLIVQFIILLQVPAIHTHDEGAYSSIAVLSLKTGLLSGDLYGYPPRHFIGFGWWLATLGVWMQVFGFGWWAARFYAFFFTLVSVPFVYLIAKRLYGTTSGVLAATFMVLSQTYLASHQIRPDAPMLFMVSLSLYLFVTQWQQPTRWGCFWLGFVSALTFEVHLVGIAFWGSWGLWLGLRWAYQSWSARRLVSIREPLLFVLGSVAPVAFFFATHILPDWGLPSAIVVRPQSFNLINYLQKEITRWSDYIASSPLEAAITTGAIAFALWRRQAQDKLLLGLLLTVAIAYVFITPTTYPQYTRYFLPLQVLLVGGMISGGQRALKPALASITLVALFGLLMNQAIRVMPDVIANGPFHRATPHIVDYVTQNVPAGSTIVMNMSYYLDFDRGDRYHYLNMSIHPPTINQLGGPPIDEVWKSFSPDFLVINQKLDEHNVWLDDYLKEAHYVELTQFLDQGLEVYVPPNSPLAK